MDLLAIRYAILRQLGQGGMSVVYEGVDRKSGQPIAIKRLPPHGVSPSALERFRREAEATARLRHPNIVELIDFVAEPPAIVLELLIGETLREGLQRVAPLPLPLTAQIVAEVAAALGAAHAAGIVHRDVKPANVFLQRAEGGLVRAKLLDFGIAKLLEPEAPPLTRSHHVIGSATYMAPEQIRGGAVDARTDVFSFGLCVYEMLTGRKSYEGNSAHEAMLRVLAGEPVPAHPALSPALYDFLRRATHTDATLRFGSAAEMARAFEAALRAPPGQSSSFETTDTRLAPPPQVSGSSVPPVAPSMQPPMPPSLLQPVPPARSGSPWPWLALMVSVLGAVAVAVTYLLVRAPQDATAASLAAASASVQNAPFSSASASSLPSARASSAASASASASPAAVKPATAPRPAAAPIACERSEKCPREQVCSGGKCTACADIVPERFGDKIASCGAAHSCVNLSRHRSHCGACGRACGPVEDCVEGVCTKSGDHGATCSSGKDCIDKFVCSPSDHTCRCPLRQNFCGGPGYNGKCTDKPCP